MPGDSHSSGQMPTPFLFFKKTWQMPDCRMSPSTLSSFHRWAKSLILNISVSIRGHLPPAPRPACYMIPGELSHAGFWGTPQYVCVPLTSWVPVPENQILNFSSMSHWESDESVGHFWCITCLWFLYTVRVPHWAKGLSTWSPAGGAASRSLSLWDMWPATRSGSPG